MSNGGKHPSDRTLIMALDGELSAPGRLKVDRHLPSCPACRTRLAALEAAAMEASTLCRANGASTAATAALRGRLQVRMTELATESDASLLCRVRTIARATPVAARLALSAALLAIAIRLVQPGTERERAFESFNPSLPISRLTPGATANVGVGELCARPAPTRTALAPAVRQEVLRQYQMERVASSEYELDYLITPELGGVADVRNLWPERYDTGVWNARVKDDLERLLPRLVCEGTVDLAIAQRDMATDWIDAYKKYFNTDRPVLRQANIADDDDDETQARRPVPALLTADVRLSVSISSKMAWQ